jgi:hypothetical protein
MTARNRSTDVYACLHSAPGLRSYTNNNFESRENNIVFKIQVQYSQVAKGREVAPSPKEGDDIISNRRESKCP